ncbi:fur family transcriptional regulator [Enterococcus sp. AZ194]|uniref:Fur family transcriptional regulator n=1 Tax=Enterococcus sp. AZ194 TaxID=2774629 RepID=UPI003F1FD09D
MNQQTLIQQSLDCLKDNGLKYTKKREALLTYLIKRNRYVSAKEVHHFMQESFPGLSYDTIYRNLHDFSELDLLEETDLNGEMKFRFHCCQGNVGHHHHFICTVCGKTKEIHMCPMNFFEEQLSGCTIEGHRFEILGRCEECQ